MTPSQARNEPSTTDVAAALASLQAQSDVLSRIVRMECLRADIPIEQAQRLIDRINHWWAFGTPEPEPSGIDAVTSRIDATARLEMP